MSIVFSRTLPVFFTVVFLTGILFFSGSIDRAHACVGGDGTKCGSEVTSTTDQLALIQKLLAQIESLQKTLIALQSNNAPLDTDLESDIEITHFDVDYKNGTAASGGVDVVWKIGGRADVALDMVCTSSGSFTTNKGNKPTCKKGGVWVWYNKSSGSITLNAPSADTPVSITLKLTVLDEDGAYTNEQETVSLTLGAARPQVTNVSFTPQSQIDYTTTSTFTFSVKNWREGLVMDIEPYINCSEDLDCEDYLFDLSQKAGDTYLGVEGDPYVKGGALYRFSEIGPSIETIQISSYPSEVDRGVLAGSVTYTVILRDTMQGGKTIWSKKFTVHNKG